MNKSIFFTLAALLLVMFSFTVSAQDDKNIFPPDYQVDTRIDNMGYWQKCAEAGLIPVQPYAPVPPALYTGSKVILRGVSVVDSPDVPVTTEPSNSTQSENSLVILPENTSILLNSNNSTSYPSITVKGADALKTFDGSETWSGSVAGAGGSNNGDPAAVIDMNGRWYVGYIDNAYGQSVSYSDDQGATWKVKKVAAGSATNLLDKNHLWVDISPSSTFKGNLYNGWMKSSNIFVSYSATSGTSWSSPVNISAATAAGSHNQGINFKCGPAGEVYAAWAVYDSWPGDEQAIGFNSSSNGGTTWGTAVRAINNIKGIRTVGVTQNMRVNSFPVMAVDLSNSPYRGTIYVVWTNTGIPGINTGSGSSVYMIRSFDKGVSWTTPKRINSDSTAGKHHYLPWITCDQANGYLSIVFYDNRNCSPLQAETWMAYSSDGGDTFTDLKVSDVTFTPTPIAGLATKYMGDYLAIAAYGGKTFPCWTDNRSGHCLTYVSPIDIRIPQPAITNIGNSLNDLTFGNGNGLMDFKETELLGLNMKNTGNAESGAVTVHLSCDSPYITMIDSLEDYGAFGINQEKFIDDGFKFAVSDSIPDNKQIIFTVEATDQNDSITRSTFQVTSHAPDVSILSMDIDDIQPGGNGNGRIDPGEEVTVYILTKNNSIWDAENVVSNLTSMNPYATVGIPTFSIGTLHAGETVGAAFPVTVSSAAAIGSAALLQNVVTSKYRETAKSFNAKVGLIVEDWETGNFDKFPWQFTDPLKPWTIDSSIKYQGGFAARSGVITHSESTGILVEYPVSLDDSISFYRRISSQSILDNLKFYIDGNLVGMWSGYSDTTFSRFSFPVMAGNHTFKWMYEKNNTSSSGLDATWADYIVFPPRYKTTAFAGGYAETCVGNDLQLHGMADSYDSVRWTTSGTGQFSNPVTLAPLYTPSAQDISDGMVQLMLTAHGIYGIDTSSMMLMIYSAPVIDAGNNGSVCRGQDYQVSGSSAIGYSTLGWQSHGDGVFDHASLLHPTYSPGVQDIQHGSVTLLLNVIGSVTCPMATDSLILTIHSLPQVELGNDTTVCAGKSVHLNATIPEATSYLWLPSNKSTPSIVVDSAGIGINSAKIEAIVTDNHGCIGGDSVMVAFRICEAVDELAGVTVQVFPNPNNGFFKIVLQTRKQEKLDISILSTSGETVYTRSGIRVSAVATENIDVTGLAKGSYLLRVSSESGEIFSKIVIQK